MEQFSGKKVFAGVAVGKLYYYDKKPVQVVREKVTDIEAEKQRYMAARDKAIDQLNALHDKTVQEIGEADAAIFEMHAMLLQDDDYNDSVTQMIETQNVNAEFAVASTGDNFYEIFSNIDDEYMKNRAPDMRYISERVVKILMGKDTGMSDLTEPVIIVAEDLEPSETVQMDRNNLLAFVTRLGSSNSHTAILARTMAIPALVQVDIDESWNGKMGIVDGQNGVLYVDPDQETLEKYQSIVDAENQKKELLKTLKGKENITKSGHKVNIYANIGSTADLGLVLQNDAGGIGLFRSEFIYLGSQDYPSEEEQFQIYKKVAETMGGRKVIIRTLDIGADKQVDYFHLDHEDNPALGFRAIRICLTRPEIFKTQLRAIFRAAMFGNISVMYPMITSVEEVHQIKTIVGEVQASLTADGIPFKDCEQGIMVETPAAALCTDDLAKEVDFFSLGTNDLTQYTLAIDRMNNKLDRFFNPHHPAVLKLIRLTIENAHKHGIWAGICGELGADLSLTQTFMDMGIDELSVAPGSILPLRAAVRNAN